MFDDPGRQVAIRVAQYFSILKHEIEQTFGWLVDFSPKVKIVFMREAEFQRAVGTDYIIAFAVPRGNIIVLDLLRAEKDPSGLEAVLKHEIVHLYLRELIKKEDLPRWLNEGVAQWMSGGASELYRVGRPRAITKATITKKLIPLSALGSFPMQEKQLQLAYEQSQSIVEFIVAEYGKQRLFDLLGALREGTSIETASMQVFGISLYELERNWRRDLGRRHTWMLWLSNNLYIVLFAAAAFITFLGFLRTVYLYKTYKDDDDDDTFDYKTYDDDDDDDTFTPVQ